MQKYDDKQSLAIKASDQNGEIVGKNGLQILTFWPSLQTGKMSYSSRNGGRQTANAGNVRSHDPPCRSREKNTGCLISLVIQITNLRLTGRSFYFSLSISAPFYEYLKLLVLH